MKKILFLQSQPYFYADSKIQAAIIAGLDRDRFEVFVACTAKENGVESPAYAALKQIPNLTILPTVFGPSISGENPFVAAFKIVSGSIGAVVSLTKLTRYTAKNRIDIVHCAEKPRDVFIGLILTRLIHAQILVHLHIQVKEWVSPLSRWAMKYADALVGVSDFVAHSLLKMGYDPTKIDYIHNGLNLSEWSDHNEQMESDIRQEFDIAEGAPLFVSIGRLVWYKRQKELIQSFAGVAEVYPTAKLLIVGESHDHTDDYPHQLHQLAIDLGLSKQVIFTGFRKDVRIILSESDVFVFPTFEEPFGMVFLEAMALKKPVVAMKSGAVEEIVEDGKTGLLSDLDNQDQLIDNMIKLADSPFLLDSLGQAGYERVKIKFSEREMVSKFEKKYTFMIQRKLNE